MPAMTKAEKARDKKIRELGCIACYVQTLKLGTPACSHHITDTGRRLGHTYTIPLCNPGHHKDVQPGSGKVPFHHNKEAFEAAYGTQDELFALTNKLIGYDDATIEKMSTQADSPKPQKPRKAKKKVVAAIKKPVIVVAKKKVAPAKKKFTPSPEMIARQKELQAKAKKAFLEKNASAIEAAKLRSKAFMAERRRQFTARQQGK